MRFKIPGYSHLFRFSEMLNSWLLMPNNCLLSDIILRLDFTLWVTLKGFSDCLRGGLRIRYILNKGSFLSFGFAAVWKHLWILYYHRHGKMSYLAKIFLLFSYFITIMISTLIQFHKYSPRTMFSFKQLTLYQHFQGHT